MSHRSPSPVFPLLSLVLTLAMGATVRADVRVVDAANGPGTDHTTIAAAVAAAAEGDVLLIRSGTYGTFVIDGKSLLLQAEADADVLVSFGISVRNLGVGQFVALRGIDAQAGQLGSALTVSACAGVVWVEDAQLHGTGPFVPFPGGGVVVTNSTSVVLARCVVEPFEHQFLNPGLNVQVSGVTLHETTVNGVKGFDQAGAPNPGGAGLRLVGASLVAADSTIVGGAGGNFTGFAPCSNGGPGGTGLELRLGSTAQLHGTQVLGGPGGATLAPCTSGATGPTTDVDGSSTLNIRRRGLGTMVLGSPVREGETYMLDASAEPGAFAWALYGTEPTTALLTSSYLGALHVPLTPFLFEALGTVPSGGTLGASFTAGPPPPGAAALVWYAQLVTFSPVDGRIRVGGVTLVCTLDDTL